MQKLTSWFTTGSGWALILIFIGAGLSAIQSHFTGNVAADIGLIISVIGLIAHPTNMTGGRSL